MGCWECRLHLGLIMALAVITAVRDAGTVAAGRTKVVVIVPRGPARTRYS
jgi:hypothetical protein